MNRCIWCILLQLFATSPLHASLFVGFNPDSEFTSYIEYDPSTFSFVGVPTLTNVAGGSNGPITAMAFDSNGNLNIGVEATPGFSRIETWDVSTGTLLNGSFNIIGVAGLARHPDGRLFMGQHITQLSTTAYAQYDPTLGNFFDQVETSSSGGSNGPITAMAFDSNGNLNIGVEATPGFSRIETWDVSTGTLLGTSPPVAGLAGLALQPTSAIPEPTSLALCSVLAFTGATFGWRGRRKIN